MKTLAPILSLALLVGCSSNATKHAYVGWMEGEVQNDYTPSREIAAQKLVAWEGKVPEASDTENYLEYLSVLDASGKTAEAETKIKKFLSDNPTEKRAVFLLGVHYLRLKKRELANYFFNQLEKDAKFPWKSLLYNNLGMLALQDKNRAQALGFFEKAVKADPPTAAPLVNLGALYLQSRSYQDAEGLFKKAWDLDPDFEDAALGYGASLEGVGKFEEAAKVYEEFGSRSPGAVSVLFNHAILLGNRLNKREQASQLMLRYIQKGGKETAKAHEIIGTWR